MLLFIYDKRASNLLNLLIYYIYFVTSLISNFVYKAVCTILTYSKIKVTQVMVDYTTFCLSPLIHPERFLRHFVHPGNVLIKQ